MTNSSSSSSKHCASLSAPSAQDGAISRLDTSEQQAASSSRNAIIIASDISCSPLAVVDNDASRLWDKQQQHHLIERLDSKTQRNVLEATSSGTQVAENDNGDDSNRKNANRIVLGTNNDSTTAPLVSQLHQATAATVAATSSTSISGGGGQTQWLSAAAAAASVTQTQLGAQVRQRVSQASDQLGQSLRQLYASASNITASASQSAAAGQHHQADLGSASRASNLAPPPPPPLYHNLPGIVPYYHGRNIGPPPSYDDVINPYAPPPTYQSLFGQMREARKRSSSFLELLKRLVIILASTLGCTLLIASMILIPFTMIIIGGIFIDQCKIEHIPAFLLLGGLVWASKNIVHCYAQCSKQLAAEQSAEGLYGRRSAHYGGDIVLDLTRSNSSSSTNSISSSRSASSSRGHNHHLGTLDSSFNEPGINHNNNDNAGGRTATTTTTSNLNALTTALEEEEDLQLGNGSTSWREQSTRNSGRHLTSGHRNGSQLGTLRLHRGASNGQHIGQLTNTETNTNNSLRLKSSICESLLNCILFGWFIAGCVIVFRNYEPDFENISSARYCHKTVYMYTFWLITSAMLLFGLFISCICCLMISSVVASRQDDIDMA